MPLSFTRVINQILNERSESSFESSAQDSNNLIKAEQPVFDTYSHHIKLFNLNKVKNLQDYKKIKNPTLDIPKT